MRTTITMEVTLEVEVEFDVFGAEPDVDIMSSYASEVTMLHNGKAVSQEVLDVLGNAFQESLLEKVNEKIEDLDQEYEDRG